MRFLRDVAEAGPLQPLYGIGGERELPEEHARRTWPVSAAPARCASATPPTQQLQTRPDGRDGAVPRDLADRPAHRASRTRRDLPADRAAGRARRSRCPSSTTPGSGSSARMPRHYTFSQAMCWVAAHRGAELARRLRPARAGRRWGAWARPRSATHPRARLQRASSGFFTQALDGQHPDASNLLLPDARPARRRTRASSRPCAPTSGCWSSAG